MTPGLRHLDEFIKAAKSSTKRREYVRFPGFKALYVRYVTRYIGGEFVHPVIDLANMEAEEPGNGAFTNLLSHLKKTYPECWIYVESVVNPRFARKLERLEFISQPAGLSECFYIKPQVSLCPICEKMSVLVSSLSGRICPECAALQRKESNEVGQRREDV